MNVRDLRLPFKIDEKWSKVVVISALVSVFILSLYLIWHNPNERQQESQSGSALNTTVPEPSTPKINGGKLQQTPRDKVQGMVDNLVSHDEKETKRESAAVENRAYQGAAKTAATFYDHPKIDHEKIRLQAELAALKEQVRREQKIASAAAPENTIEDQLTIIERSYELAAKYSTPQQTVPQNTPQKEVEILTQPSRGVVSSLTQMSDANFTTAVGGAELKTKNTIAACIAQDQTITNSGVVKIRVLESMKIGGYELPRGATITGQGRVSGERLTISISQIEHQGNVIRTDLQVIDTDGSEGIFIPNSTEVGALKKIVANMGRETGQTISVAAQSVGAELLTDLGKSAISGVAEYADEKAREVRVHLKAGYKVMLYQAKK